jgi:membrane-associated phospholipid phosphatase
MRRSPRYLLAWAGACVAAFVAVLSLAYFLPAARHADRAAVADFGRLDRHWWLHDVSTAFSVTCDWIEYTVIVALFLWAAWRWRGPRIAAAAGLLLIGANVSSQVLKELLAYPRDRPAIDHPHFHFIADAAFPSGHGTAAMALAAAVVLAVPRAYRTLAAFVGIAYTLAVSFSILVLQWHFVSDVIGGFLLATAWSLIALAAYRAAQLKWPAAGGMRTAARQAVALADWRVTAGAVLVGVLLAIAVALTRISQVVTLAKTHTAFVVAVTAVAASAAALLAGVAAVSGRRG